MLVGETMNILISIDDNYVKYAINLIASIKKNNDNRLNIFLIHDARLSDESINLLKKFVDDNNIGKLNTIYFNDDTINLPKYIDYISINTYYRLFAPYLLPLDVDRILYLDSDIICNGDISELYNCDFKDNLIIGCENMLPKHLQVWRERNINRLELPSNYTYINAGVLMINIKKYREDVSQKEIIEFIKDNINKLIFQDQDVINKMFFDKIKLIDNKYNYQINTVEVDNIIDDIRLVHYSERLKPWNMDYNEPLKAIFYYKVIKDRGYVDLLKTLIYKHYENKANDLYNKLIDKEN